MPSKELLQQLEKWKKKFKIVLVTGVFDIIHIEHIRFLSKAKKVETKLIVGIETDKRVKKIKGGHRPINNQIIRLEQLTSLKAVDHAFLLPQDFSHQQDWESFIQVLKPDIYAVSSHTSYLDNKKKTVEKFGCNFSIVHQYNPEYSSSKLHRRLLREL